MIYPSYGLIILLFKPLITLIRLHIPNSKSGYQKLENSALVDLTLSDDDRLLYISKTKYC